MISANREVLLIVAGIFFLLPAMLLAFNMPDFERVAFEDPAEAQAAVLQFYAEAWWILLIVGLASIVGYLALLTLLRDSARPTVGEALKVGAIGLLPAIGTYLLFVFGCGLAAGIVLVLLSATGSAAVAAVGVIALILGFIYLSIKASMSAPVIAIERVYNPVAVLVRSWKLTRGNSLRLFAFGALLFVAYVVISAVLQLVLTAFRLALDEMLFKVFNSIVSGALSTVVAVLAVALLAAIHRQLADDGPARVGETFE